MGDIAEALISMGIPLFAKTGHGFKRIDLPRPLFMALWVELGDAAVSWVQDTRPGREQVKVCHIAMNVPWGTVEIYPGPPIQRNVDETAQPFDLNGVLVVQRRHGPLLVTPGACAEETEKSSDFEQ